MGLTATSARKYQLMSTKLTIQYEMQKIANAQSQLMNIMDVFGLTAGGLTPGSAALNQQEQYMAYLQRQDKRIALLLERKKKQVEAIDTEMKSLDQIIKEGIKQNFSYMA